ncbi:hypothetical protein BDZ89DRAFT_1135395 [Hymenopellis radicata]|nr:hypothetical protein BDZ89DRAFT_1135395 [Hymenopellis radicata]
MSSCFNPNPFLSLDRTEIPSPRVSTNLDQTTLPSVGPSRTRRSGRRSSPYPSRSPSPHPRHRSHRYRSSPWVRRSSSPSLSSSSSSSSTDFSSDDEDDETPWATVALDPSVRRASPSDQPSAMQGKILLAQQEPASEQTAPTQPPPPRSVPQSQPVFHQQLHPQSSTSQTSSQPSSSSSQPPPSSSQPSSSSSQASSATPSAPSTSQSKSPIPEPSIKPVVTSVPHEPWSGSCGSQVSGKIPKPVGEVGRPKRGGYNLEKTLGWPASLFSDVKREIKVLVYEKMDCRTGFAHQPQSKIEYVHEEALVLYPWLDRYEKLWVVDDFIRGHLKYRKSALQREDDAQRHIQAQERIQELESRRQRDH